MKEDMKARLRFAIEQLGLNDKAVSLGAGLNASYVHDFLERNKGGSYERLERICKVMGIRWEWLKNAQGSMEQAPETPALDRASITTILESILQHFRPHTPLARIRATAELLLAVAEDQPTGKSESDRQSSIHSEIRGVLRGFLAQSDPENLQ